MAIIQVGPIVQAISGRVGGVVFAQGHGGSTVRSRRARKNTWSPAAENQRRIILICQKWWATLDPEDKLPWNEAAARLNVVNRLGLRRRLSGRELFIRDGVIDFMWRGGTYFYLPVYIDFPTVAGLNMCMHDDLVQVWPAWGTWNVRVDMMIYGARSSSVSGWRRRQFVWLKGTYTYPWSPAVDITSEWTSKLGLLPEGERFAIAVRWRKVSSVWSEPFYYEGKCDNSAPVGPT